MTAFSIHKEEKILLVLMPFWTSLIPPLGISCLKSYLQAHEYRVKVADANIEKDLNDIYNKYFQVLRDVIPPKKRGNFYNIGHDVLRNHMMAHLNYDNEKKYSELVHVLISKNFFHHVDAQPVVELNQIIDAFYWKLEKYLLDLLGKEKPSVLGLSVYNGNLPASFFAFKLAKKMHPHIRMVMGGGVFADQLNIGSPNFDFFLQKAPFIDKIIVGEGEELFLKLLRGELPQQQQVYTLADIGREMMNLEKAMPPDYSDLDIQHYPTLGAYASRSCPFQCSFCSETVQWGKYRKKKAAQIADELIKLSKHHNYQLFLMGDSLLNPVANDLAHELIKREAVVYWDGYLRADKNACDSENTLTWRRGGFYRARLGVESGSQRVLDLMGKGVTVEQIMTAVSSLAKSGIKTTTYWVIGHPDETEADFQLTLDLIENLKDDIYEADCNPFNFYMGGQVNSSHWRDKSVLLYPEAAADMLVAQTWILDCEPSREETYDRIVRFVEHCRKLGIPNPYSLNDIYKADERWKTLQKNAGPSLLDFKKNGTYIDECRKVRKLLAASHKTEHDGNWGF